MMRCYKMIQQNLKHFVEINNETASYYTFVKLLMKSEAIESITSLVGKKSSIIPSLGSKIKTGPVEYSPHDGRYDVSFDGHSLVLSFQTGEAKLTTECRQIEYLKKVTVYGPSLEIIKQFVESIYELGEEHENSSMITIYQNNGGHWNTTKTKKARKLESVVFEKEFIDSILQDIEEFISSEDWYQQMGIPYKRSYLLYGPPGTGKSSLAQALAGHYSFSICCLNCSDNINDFSLNSLLNRAPKKAIVLLEDVDSIFAERKSVEKVNTLTFSGFLNAIDGVRSQEGRIIIMTTNYKERLDPALLRPGRTDEAFEIKLASKFQIQKLCERFFKNQALALEFADRVPAGKFSMSMLQGFFVKFRKHPEKILEKIDEFINSDENVKIDQFLEEINCLEALNHFKIDECSTLSQAKNLPKSELDKIAGKLSLNLGGRLIQAIRSDRKSYIKTPEQIELFISQQIGNEQIITKLRSQSKKHSLCTFYQIKDLVDSLASTQ